MRDRDANGETSNGRERSYAALVEEASFGDQESSVVIGHIVSENAISRSALLSGIADTCTEGLASLHSQLSLEEVKLWETAYVADVAFSPLDLVTILKV